MLDARTKTMLHQNIFDIWLLIQQSLRTIKPIFNLFEKAYVEPRQLHIRSGRGMLIRLMTSWISHSRHSLLTKPYSNCRFTQMTWYNICTGASPAAEKPSRPLKMRLKPLKLSHGGKEYHTRIPNSKIAGGSVVSMGIIFLLFTKVLLLSFLVDCIHSWILQILAQCTQLHQKLTFSQSPYCRKHDHEWVHLQHLKSHTEIMIST